MAKGGAARRWLVVGAVVAVLVALPLVIGAWPAPDQDRSAAQLRSAAIASANIAFSGEAQSAGGLALPATDRLDSVTDLFSARATMRVWWRSSIDHRVDVLTSAGESDVYTDASGAWTWDYEADQATRTQQRAALDLPAPTDLLPTTLARRLLSEAEPAELSRAGAQRVAGRDALGLQLTPALASSSVARVQLWIDAVTGLPLQVQLYGVNAVNPALDTRFLELQLGMPDASITAFTPPAGADLDQTEYPDVLRLADRLSALPLPASLAGLPRRTIAGAPAAIGLYGRGVTLLAVVPLPYGVAADLRTAAAADPSAVTDDTGTRLAAGPLGILLSDTSAGESYLLTGTVTLDALRQAARQLPDLGGSAVTPVITTQGLAKHFGQLRAVDGIDLDVQAGDVYGFLGANGSGKTTTVRMLLGLVLPTSGRVEVLGAAMPKSGRRVLPRVGALIEGPAFYGHLAGRENLALLDASGPGGSRRNRRARIDRVLEEVGLAGVAKRPVRAYSLGMRQRLGLAGALLRRPELLILDEPTNGLDPQGIAEIRALLLELNGTGTTVFLSSHLLAEIEQMATRVGVLDRGRLVLQERLSVLTAPTGATVVNSPQPDRVQQTLNGRVTAVDGERVVVRGSDPAEVNARLVAAGVPVTGLALDRPTLEQVVLAAAGASSDRVDKP